MSVRHPPDDCVFPDVCTNTIGSYICLGMLLVIGVFTMFMSFFTFICTRHYQCFLALGIPFTCQTEDADL